MAKEARLPGLAAWIRVLDYRASQLERDANVELAYDSRLDADGGAVVRLRPRLRRHRVALARPTASAAVHT